MCSSIHSDQGFSRDYDEGTVMAGCGIIQSVKLCQAEGERSSAAL